MKELGVVARGEMKVPFAPAEWAPQARVRAQARQQRLEVVAEVEAAGEVEVPQSLALPVPV